MDRICEAVQAAGESLQVNAVGMVLALHENDYAGMRKRIDAMIESLSEVNKAILVLEAGLNTEASECTKT